MIKHISILGDGAWGTSLALLFAEKGIDPLLWGPSEENIRAINVQRENLAYLKGVRLPERVSATADLEEWIAFSETYVLAVPSRFVPAVLDGLRNLGLRGGRWIIATKGILAQGHRRMSQLLEDNVAPDLVGVLSGPAIAREVVAGLPTALVFACEDEDFGGEVQRLLSDEKIRIYTSGDVLGVEWCGGLKNVMAISAGICDGLGLGTNSKSALLTRCVAEMSRFVVGVGGRKETVYGISGLGDLLTTAFSPHSRNRRFGEAIARGSDPQEYLRKSTTAVEGAYTVPAVLDLARELGISVPISEAVYQVVFEGLSPEEALRRLMSRPLKSEIEE